MKETTLKEIEERIKRNNEKYKKVIDAFIEKTESNPDLKKGRVRPRHPDEQRILDLFKRK